MPDCLRLTPRLVKDVPWLPDTCAYRRRAEGKPLPDWHHLLTGSRDAMIEAGACVAGRVHQRNRGRAARTPHRRLGGGATHDRLAARRSPEPRHRRGRDDRFPSPSAATPRARRLTMRLAPDGSEVRVTLPPWGRTAEALAFAKARADWIASQLAKVPGAARSCRWRSASAYRGASAAHRLGCKAPAARLSCEDSALARRRPGAKRWKAACAAGWRAEALRLCRDDLAFYCAARRPARAPTCGCRARSGAGARAPATGGQAAASASTGGW